MIFSSDSNKPIYIQLSEWLENEIILGNLMPDERIYSQYQLAEMFNINPATGAKALTQLLNEKIVFKKRGLGMFVSNDAIHILKNKRYNEVLTDLIKQTCDEAVRLSLTKKELIELVEFQFMKGGK